MPYNVTNTRVKVTSGYTTDVVVAYPPNYDANRIKPYPVVFFGYGLGTTWSGLQTHSLIGQLRNGLVPEGEFVIISVYRGSTAWISHTSYALNEFIKNGVNIDPENVFFTGLSAGAGYAMSSWFGPSTAQTYDVDLMASKVRAIVAQAINQDASQNNFGQVYKFAIPNWITVGANDQNAYIDRCKLFNTQINTRVPNLSELLIRTGVGHGGWDDVYRGTVKMVSGKNMWEFFIDNLKSDTVVVTPTVVSKYEFSVLSDNTIQYNKLFGTDTDLSTFPTTI